MQTQTPNSAFPQQSATDCERPATATATDRQLVQRYVSRGSEADFRELVRRHYAMVLGVARRLLGCPHDAEDVAQAVFLVLARDARRIRDHGAVSSWLYGVTFRTSAQLAKKRARTKSVESMEDVAVQSDPLEQLCIQFERNAVLEAVQGLAPRTRAPMLLRYIHGRSNAEVAAELKLSESAVEGRLKRGRNQLRMQLARQGVAFAAGVAVLDALHREATATVPTSLIDQLTAAACGHAGEIDIDGRSGSVNHAAEQNLINILRISEQEMRKMGTTKMIYGATVASLAVGMAVSGWALVGTGVTLAQGDGGGDDPFGRPAAKVVVKQPTAEANTVATFGTGFGAGGGGDKDDSTAIAQAQSSSGRQRSSAGSRRTARSNVAAIHQQEQRLRQLGYYHIPYESKAEMKILEELRNSPATLQFQDTPLSTVVDHLREAHSIQILFDTVALEEASLSPSDSITVNVEGLSLENALALMLEPLELTTVVRNDVLMITSQAVASESLLTRVYRTPPTWDISQDDIANAITSVIMPDSWVQQGGWGSVTPIGDGLLVYNTRDAQAKISQLFGQLERLNSGGKSSD